VANRLVESGGRLTEERRLVTALFADISGFSRLADQLDPEQLLEVIDPIIRRLSNLVGRYEGYVEKFAGDAILAFFGAPVSHEDDAARAVLTALEMHRELSQGLRSAPLESQGLQLHVGVNSGHVVARILGSELRLDYAVLGEAVILAQRLQAAAPAGETYVGESTYRLTARRFEFAPLGELTVKGKRGGVTAWRLIGERSVTSSTGSQAAAALYGRDSERDWLRRALADRLATGGKIAVFGEAGIGKSQLVAAARREAERDGLCWLEARCLSYGGTLTYWPFADLARRLLGIRRETPEDVAAQIMQAELTRLGVAETAPYLMRLVGLPEPEGESLEPEALRRRLPAALGSWLRAVAGSRPLVLAIEDIHWADQSSVALAHGLLGSRSDTPIVLLVTSRPEATPNLEQMLTSAAADVLELKPLGRAALAELAEAILGGRLTPEFEALIAERTGGNPFFVEETLRSLRDVGALVKDGDRWTTTSAAEAQQVPATIEAAISARIDLLPRTHVSVLQAAAVVGRRAWLPLVRAVTTERVNLDGVLDELVERRFLDRESGAVDAVSFHHALIQEVAYARLLRRHQKDLHLKVADAAEQLYGSGDDVIDVLARHLFLADAGAKAIDALIRASQRARRLFANSEALLQLGRAAELARKHPDLTSKLQPILLELAQLRERSGHYDEALRLYSEVRTATGDTSAWRGEASILRKKGQFQSALQLIDEAFAAQEGTGADQRLLWLERALCLNGAGRFRESALAALTGLGAAPDKRDLVAAHLLLRLTWVATLEGRYDDALARGIEAQRIFEEHEDLPGLVTTLRIVGYTYRSCGRLDEGAATLNRGLQLAERVGAADEIGGCLINLGMIERDRGDLDRAIDCDRRAIQEFETAGHGIGRGNAYGNLAEKLVLVGSYDEADQYCQLALRIAEEIGNPVTAALARRTKALVVMYRGDLARGAWDSETAAEELLRMGIPTAAVETLRLSAEALDKGNDHERAGAQRRLADSIMDRASAAEPA
jgi:class 3 adenylate cyclase/tetratricopeptide (TPR) repeat protein